MMEAASTSKTLVNSYQTTRCYNPEGSHLRTRRCENLKSYKEEEVLQIGLFEILRCLYLVQLADENIETQTL
jgi:hypothetical protein